MRVLYTDGSHNHGVSGWAIVEDMECIYQNWGRGLTSNIAEGLAILQALKIVQGDKALILSDSLAWVKALTDLKPIKGKGAKEIYEQAAPLLHPNIQLRWVPSHTDYLPGNELADEYASQARHCRISTEP